jgi:hypothetical protein
VPRRSRFRSLASYGVILMLGHWLVYMPVGCSTNAQVRGPKWQGDCIWCRQVRHTSMPILVSSGTRSSSTRPRSRAASTGLTRRWAMTRGSREIVPGVQKERMPVAISAD